MLKIGDHLPNGTRVLHFTHFENRPDFGHVLAVVSEGARTTFRVGVVRWRNTKLGWGWESSWDSYGVDFDSAWLDYRNTAGIKA
jgi:hypothetical protein